MGGGVKNGDEIGVRFLVWEVLPPMGDQDRDALAADGLLDLVEDAVVRPIA